MQKTKLGVAVGLLGAAAYFASLFGGYTPVLLIAGYVLLFEENEWLKKSCVKAVLLMIVIGAVRVTIGLIPDILDSMSGFMAIFHVYFLRIDTAIFGITINIINIIEKILFLILGIKALNQGTITIPVVDKMIHKYMN